MNVYRCIFGNLGKFRSSHLILYMSRCERHYIWRKVQYVLLAVINLFKMAEDPHVEYIEKWLTPVVEDMITEVLLNKPEDPIEFMINWLQNKKGSASDSAFSP